MTLRSLATLAVVPFTLSACASLSTNTSEGPPNILFIFSDDHAAHAISAYGSVLDQTPNIDRLASEGVLFRNCFCGNSICGPSRATVLTGLHSHANGFMRNGNQFDGEQQTFPKLLQGAGYETAMIGKWHLGVEPSGFDHWIVLPGQGQYYNPDFKTPEGNVRLEGHCTELVTDLALEWLEEGREGDKPFLLMCQHKAPHRTWMPAPTELAAYRDREFPEPPTLFDDYAGRGPAAPLQTMEIDRHMYMFYDCKLEPTEEEAANLQGPDQWWEGPLERMNDEQRATWNEAFAEDNAEFRAANLEGDALISWKYQRYMRNYLGSAQGVDRSVGQILDWLDEHPEIAENTIVVYSSDQGFYLGDHGWYDKRWMYEESLRMPFLVRWPGHTRAGEEVTALAQNIDFAPTFLAAAGVEAPEPMHGRSLIPLLDGDAPSDWRDAIYYRYWQSHSTHDVAAHYGVRTDRYKLIYYYDEEHRYWELFDLETDPDELTSVADDPAYAEIRAELAARLVELQAQYGDAPAG